MSKAEIVVVPLSQNLIEAAVSLQAACFPHPFDPDLLWKADHLEAHIARFPEGQFAAVIGTQLVGTASSLIVTEETWGSHMDWQHTVGGHYLVNHTADGSTLYGVDISVDPAFRGRGVARQLYQARFDLVRSRNLTRFGTAVRMPDFAESGYPSPLEYANIVSAGMKMDRTLTPMLRMGLRLVGVIENYMEDAESGNAAALLEWTP